MGIGNVGPVHPHNVGLIIRFTMGENPGDKWRARERALGGR